MLPISSRAISCAPLLLGCRYLPVPNLRHSILLVRDITIRRRGMEIELPPLPDVERLSPKVIRVLGGNPGKFTLQGTNTYLVGTGPTRTLVDTGQGEQAWVSNLQRALADEHASVGTVLLTHWHADHVCGVPDLFKTIAPAARVFKMRPSYLGQGDNAARIQRLSTSGALRNAEWGDIADGQTFTVEPGLTLRALYCPGHTSDHMAFVLDDAGSGSGVPAGFFTGDNVLGMGTTVFEDLAAYMSSLDRMRAALPASSASTRLPAFPGHGPAIDDAHGKISEYISHRHARERQVLRVLGDGGLTSTQITKTMYRDVPANLHEAAERGVNMILEKLEKDGTVMRDVVDEDVWQKASMP